MQATRDGRECLGIDGGKRGAAKFGRKTLLKSPPAGSALPLKFRRLEVGRFGDK